MVRTLIKLIAAVLVGMGAHQFYRPSLTLGERTGALFRNATGGLAMIPTLLLLCDDFDEISNHRIRLLVTYLVNLGAIGTGVFIGHLMDDHSR